MTKKPKALESKSDAQSPGDPNIVKQGAIVAQNPTLSAAQNELKAQIFNKGLTAWREWIVDLQRRLCRDLVAIALANRECLGTNPLDWVNECIDNYWVTHRPGFKNWAALCCDWADPKTWTAPGGY